MSKNPDTNDFHLKHGPDAVRAVLDKNDGERIEAPAPKKKKKPKEREKRPRREGEPWWPDLTAHGNPKKTCANARVAIEALGVSCRYDEFHDTVVIESDDIENLSSGNADHDGHLLHLAMHDRFRFDPGKEHVHDAMIQIALRNRFDPVCDYLRGFKWDGKKRLDKFLHTYFSAEDTELNSWFGKLTLVAGVRRARRPGSKFDHILVIEGPEGSGKSTAIKLLAIADKNFSDQTILGMADNKQQELLRGKWIYEIGEMHGMKRSEVEQVKAFVTRTEDRGRPAYGRSVIDQKRRCIFIGTTNDDHYLKSQTGNRRWWPVKTGTINLDAWARDIDQIWAEAAELEATGIALTLPYELRAEAKMEQNKRLENDPWDDFLENLSADVYEAGDGKQEFRISSDAIFENYLQVPRGKRTPGETSRLKNAMNRLGWQGPDRVYIGRPGEELKRLRGYRRLV
jgi:predicted P-loop ATPase